MKGKEGINFIILLATFLTLFTLIGNFLVLPNLPKETSRSRQSTSQPKIPDKPGWRTYVDPEFGYSLQIPQEWMEIPSYTGYSNKEFRLFPTRPTPPAVWAPKVQLYIIVSNRALLQGRRTGADYQNAMSYFENMRSAPPGAILPANTDWARYVKIANVSLDNCDAVQTFAQSEKSYSYSTYCLGKYFDITVAIYIFDKTELNKFKLVYEEILKTFKLNDLLGAKGDSKARDSVTKSDMKKIATDLSEYYFNSNLEQYPVSLNELVKAGILESIPKTLLGENYGYLRCANGQGGEIFSRIEETGTYWVVGPFGGMRDTQSTQPPTACIGRY